MEQEILTQLQQLHASFVIDEQETALLQATVAYLEDRHHIYISGNCGSMFLHHMAMLLERLRFGEDVCAMDPHILARLWEDPRYQKKQPVVQGIATECGIPISPREAAYIGLYLCSLELADESLLEQT